MNTRKVWIAGLVGAFGLVAAGCATTPIPVDKLTRAQASIKTAHELNAERDPSASLYLRLANEQVTAAKKHLEDGDNDRASLILLRAEADADAALNLARHVSAQTEARQTMERIQEIKTQMEGPKS